GGETSISKTVLDRVLTERVTLLSTDAQEDERLALARSLIIQQVHSVMCAPLLVKEETAGVIYVDCRDPLKTFSSDDLDLLNALAAATSMAIDNASTHDQLVREALARAAYSRFMPRHVVNELLTHPDSISLGGTNQIVTMLFSDIRGFTSMSEGLSPETVVQILNKYFAEMTPLVFAHKGMLDKYIGDGLMALFGVPYQSDDAAGSAVQAAIAMERAMAKLNQELKLAGLPDIAIGIGVNTGNVTVGYIGSEQRTDYTAIGDSVNLAARLEKQAGPGQILISRSTFEALKEPVPTRLFGEIKVKGKKESVQVYEVLWQDRNETGALPVLNGELPLS
ncbi:MAG: adenylate/guanylate cyclase domain-containing protein, partial [Blastocatellia bacterium]